MDLRSGLGGALLFEKQQFLKELWLSRTKWVIRKLGWAGGGLPGWVLQSFCNPLPCLPSSGSTEQGFPRAATWRARCLMPGAPKAKSYTCSLIWRRRGPKSSHWRRGGNRELEWFPVLISPCPTAWGLDTGEGKEWRGKKTELKEKGRKEYRCKNEINTTLK